MKPRRVRERTGSPFVLPSDIIREADLNFDEYNEYQNLAYAVGPLEDDYSEESEP